MKIPSYTERICDRCSIFKYKFSQTESKLPELMITLLTFFSTAIFMRAIFMTTIFTSNSPYQFGLRHCPRPRVHQRESKGTGSSVKHRSYFLIRRRRIRGIKINRRPRYWKDMLATSRGTGLHQKGSSIRLHRTWRSIRLDQSYWSSISFDRSYRRNISLDRTATRAASTWTGPTGAVSEATSAWTDLTGEGGCGVASAWTHTGGGATSGSCCTEGGRIRLHWRGGEGRIIEGERAESGVGPRLAGAVAAENHRHENSS